MRVTGTLYVTDHRARIRLRKGTILVEQPSGWRRACPSSRWMAWCSPAGPNDQRCHRRARSPRGEDRTIIDRAQQERAYRDPVGRDRRAPNRQ